jgi:hypothetical protein
MISFGGLYSQVKHVDLPGSYPGELWKRATVSDYEWLQDEWCYPSLSGFRSRFKIEGGILFRPNEGTEPNPFKSEWMRAHGHLSDSNVLRINYEQTRTNEWPIDFVTREVGNTAAWQENQRFVNDDRSVSSGSKRLVLSCRRCRVSSDGISYSCYE